MSSSAPLRQSPERQDRVPDYLALWAIVFAHCAIVLLLLCVYTAVWLTTISLLHVEGIAAMLAFCGFAFVMPVILAGSAAWFSYRFVICNVARTDAGRKIFGLIVMLFAVTPPFYILPLTFFVGCAVARATGGSCTPL